MTSAANGAANGRPVRSAVAGRARPVATLATLAISAFGYSLASTELLPALPHLQHKFGSSTNATYWVLTAYVLMAAVATPVVGRTGDMFGRRRVLIFVLSMFVLGSTLAALAPTLALLIVARCLQGVAGALLPLAYGIVRDTLPPERVAVGISFVSAMTAVGGGIGLPIGGLVVDHLTVNFIFWSGAGLALIGLAGTIIFIPDSGARAPGRLDFIGAFLLGAGLVGPLIAISNGERWGWGNATTLGLFAEGAVLLLFWWRFELRQTSPLVDIAMLRRGAVGRTILATLLLGFSLFGTFSLIPRLAQTSSGLGGFGLDATGAGLVMLPTPVINAITAPFVGIYGRKHGAYGSKKALVFGCLVAGAGLALISVAHSHPWQVAVGASILGVGFAAGMAAAPNIIIGSVGPHETGAATAANTLLQNVGSSIGSQVAITILVARTPASGNVHGGYTWAFGFAAAAAIVAAGLATRIPARARARALQATEEDDLLLAADGAGAGVSGYIEPSIDEVIREALEVETERQEATGTASVSDRIVDRTEH